MLCNQRNNLKIKLCYNFSPLGRSRGEEIERICSKLGGGLDKAIVPVDSSVAPVEGPYSERSDDLLDMVQRSIDCVNLTSVYGFLHFEIIDHLKENYRPEPDLYFYHSDHLGSSSFITDANGIVSQHLQYLPYGELFAEQRDNTARYYTPYKFSGKEKDEETGYSYFGARYYMPELSIWSAVDPMADDYPDLSPYNYCENNPIMLVDPDGNNSGWYEDNGQTVFDPKINSQQDVYDAGKTGKYYGDMGVEYASDGSVNILMPDGTKQNTVTELDGVEIKGLSGSGAVNRAMERSMNQGYDPNWLSEFNRCVEGGLLVMDAALFATGINLMATEIMLQNTFRTGTQFANQTSSGNKLFPNIKLLKGEGGKINGFSISRGRYGAKPRFDVHRLGRASKPSNSMPKWTNGRRLPHYHRGRGNNLHRHRPWEKGWNDKNFLDRF